MCQAPVGKVLEVRGDRLVVDVKGKRRELRSRLPGIGVGDYVSFSLDIAIDRIEKEEAEAVLEGMK
ncbi:MAG: HypC/HybG/HupF family hydrogenase formation chaperone [Candidatus Micrarchaeota archaeon]|nr:HypC/HybG/HupF family hydrogenase formation chaperone [Candidatus Micrarchaeota archaeon]